MCASLSEILIVALLIVVLLLGQHSHLTSVMTLVMVRASAVVAVGSNPARAADAAGAAAWVAKPNPLGRLSVIGPGKSNSVFIRSSK